METKETQMTEKKGGLNNVLKIGGKVFVTTSGGVVGSLAGCSTCAAIGFAVAGPAGAAIGFGAGFVGGLAGGTIGGKKLSDMMPD